MDTLSPNKELKLVPRAYQTKLLEYAIERNCIIYLPTGSGKTFIAVIALRHFAHDLEKPISQGGKRSIFMCNTVELARQQWAETRKLSNLRCGFYVGDRDVDNWDRSKWSTEIETNQVLIGTTQIFVDLLAHNYLKLSHLNLVIFDECHHGTKLHPMHQFMSYFQLESDKSKFPRVIGLTGVLLKTGKVNEVVENLKCLEATFRSNIITVQQIDEMHNVLLYSTKPREEFVIFDDIRYTFDSEQLINAIVQETCNSLDNWDLGTLPEKFTKNMGLVREPDKIKQVKNSLSDFLYQMTDFGLYAASVAIMSPIIEFEIKKRQSPTITLRNMYRSVITKCELVRHILVKKLQPILMMTKLLMNQYIVFVQILNS